LITDKSTYKISKESYTAIYCYMATAEKSYYITYSGDNAEIEEEDEGISCLPEGTAYLCLQQFYGGAASEMAMLIEQFNAEGCTTLILDLRENGGGYVSVMADIAPIFPGTDTKKYCMYAKYKNGDAEAFEVGSSVSESQPFGSDCKLYVLADNGTASASEALIGVLYCNGVIDYSDIYISDFSEEYLVASKTTEKNCRTYGKGIMQSTYVKAFTGEALKLTTAKIYWPDGSTTIHGTGLNTSLGCNTLKASWGVTYGDEQLQLFCSTVLSSQNSQSGTAV